MAEAGNLGLPKHVDVLLAVEGERGMLPVSHARCILTAKRGPVAQFSDLAGPFVCWCNRRSDGDGLGSGTVEGCLGGEVPHHHRRNLIALAVERVRGGSTGGAE